MKNMIIVEAESDSTCRYCGGENPNLTFIIPTGGEALFHYTCFKQMLEKKGE